MAIVLSLLLSGLYVTCLAAESNGKYLEDAKAYLRTGQVKSAIIQLKNLLKASPRHAEARFLLGESYLKIADGPSAAKEFEKARDLQLGKARWIVPLAKAYLLSGQARKLLNSLDLDKTYPAKLRAQLKALRGNAHLALRNGDSARAEFDAVLELNPSSGEGLLGKATIALMERQLQKSAEYARESLAADPKNPLTWTVLGEVNRINGRPQDALKAFNKAIELRPNLASARVGRAVMLIAVGKFDQAQKDLDFVRTSIGDFPPALYLQAVIAFQNKKLQDAEDLLIKVARVSPNHGPSQLLLGAINYSQNELESAGKNLSRYMKANPDHLSGAKLLASVKMKQKKPNEAVRLLQRFKNAANNDPQFLALIGSAYIQNKDFDRGTEMLAQAAEIAPDVAEIRTQLALGQIASGKLDQAVGELETAVDLGRNQMQADVLLVMALLKQKNYSGAIEAAQRMTDKAPNNPMPVNLIAAAFLAKGDADQAEKQWKRALSINPDYTTAALNLAKLETQKNNLKLAHQWYKQVLEKQPKSIRAMMGLAQLAEKANDNEGMVKWLKVARDKNPNALEPLLMLSRYYLLQGESLKALKIARDANSRHPDNQSALKTLGLTQSASGSNASARATFKKLILKFPGNPVYHHLLAQVYYRDGQTDDANEAWKTALRLAPDYLPAVVARTASAIKAGDYRTALAFSNRLIRDHPNLPEGYRLEGDSRLGLKQLKKAKAAYEKAYGIKPTSALAQKLFQTNNALGDLATAFAVLENWLDQAVDDAASWTVLAMGYQSAGNNSKALSAYEKAYRLVPTNRVIVNNLAWLYQETGNKKAVQLADQALDLADNDPQVLDTVGWIFIQNGRLQRGLVLLQQASVLAPHIPDIRFHLAEAFNKAGRKEEAVKELDRLLKQNKDFPNRDRAENLLKSFSTYR